MPRFLTIILITIIGSAAQLYSQQHMVSFKHLTIDDGLSQNSVNCIYQDKNGFMWFGTHDGLNKFNGYEFEYYRNDRSNENSLSSNYIYDVYEDNEGVLWVATFGGGLNSIHPETGEIKAHEMIPEDENIIPDERIFSISEYPEGILWIGCNGGLIRYNKRTSKARLFTGNKKSEDIYFNNYVGIVCPDELGNIWFQTDSGLTKIDTSNLNIEYFKKSPYSNKYKMGFIQDIKSIPNGVLVACDDGLLLIDEKHKRDELLLSTEQFNSGGRETSFLEFDILKPDHYLIGSNQGLIIYDHKTGRISRYQANAYDPKSLTHNSILSICKSRDGVLWLGTRNGINIIESLEPDFKHIRSIPGESGMSSNNVTSFMEMNDSLFWIGTTNGLNLYNKNTYEFKVYNAEQGNSGMLLSGYILSLYKDSKNRQWVGTRGGGFYKIIPHGDRINFKQIQPLNDTLFNINTHYFRERENGNLWVGTGGQGLWEYDPDRNLIKRYESTLDAGGLNHSFVFCFHEDTFNNLWTGTPSGGLNMLNTQSGRFLFFLNNPENLHSINNDIILSIYEDSNNKLWVGTNDGLAKFIPTLDSDVFPLINQSRQLNQDTLFINFGLAEGFPNTVIYGMLEDEHDQLWISTNSGLVVFDTKNETVIKTFDVSDGLQSNEFNQNAFYTDAHGQFYFGGVNGFNIFNPDEVTGNNFKPQMLITGLSIFNKPLQINKPNEDGLYLDKSISNTEKINLSWKDRVITFHFAGLSYKSPEKNQYSYKLEGFNNDWVMAGNNRSATYTQLDPGTYTFRVKAANNSGIWDEAGSSLIIHISTPPWLAWYAYTLYILIIVGIAYLFIRYRIRRATRKIRLQATIDRAREEEREVFRKQSAADFHDEAGNKITKLTLFTEMARSELENKTQLENYLGKIQQNITELSSGMRDFLWVMDPQHDSLFETIARLKDFGESLLTETGVNFIVKGIQLDLQEINLSMNARRDILQIFKEAMNNAAKYAKANNITLEVIKENNQFKIKLEDDGRGFNLQNLDNKRYGLRIMKERTQKIGGELIINSGENSGTSISLKCNIPHLGNSN
ncbi:MAG TPA: two-component regulator propeller domain-containing protein [Bacteroidales bacterium]|nr:two-component regulator propeller domain-containing protein [Bacteroidales bacterium]HRX95701.1 two-component regulator propeller domain-containing protein [Bacteroidales bacterium]